MQPPLRYEAAACENATIIQNYPRKDHVITNENVFIWILLPQSRLHKHLYDK